ARLRPATAGRQLRAGGDLARRPRRARATRRFGEPGFPCPARHGARRAGAGSRTRARLCRRAAGHRAGGSFMTATALPIPAAPTNDRGLDPHLPQTPTLSAAWRERQARFTLATRARRRQRRVIVIGSGLAGAAAAATLSELGFQVSCLCIQDSPRRAHSVAA